MRILLLGDYSGLYVNLKKGLETLGHEVTLMSNGDLWKNIHGADRPLFSISSDNTFTKKIYNRICEPIIHRDVFYGYDVVQSVHSVVFDPLINTHMINFIKNNNEHFFINLCGSSIVLYKWWKYGKNTYYPYSDCPEKIKRFESYVPFDIINKKSELAVTSKSDGILTTSYSYFLWLPQNKNEYNIIPLPTDLSHYQYDANNLQNNKVSVYHGITRPREKGTPYIQEAMEYIQSKYPNDVNITLTNRLTFQEYLEVLKSSNVLIEACTDVDWGMNALFAMAHGRVAMTGANKDIFNAHGISSCPIFNIEHSTKHIIQQMEYIIDNRHLINQWGQESNIFVKMHHDATLVAQKYLDTWAI